MLNNKLKEKFELFEEIDRISSNENTKQSSFKNKDSFSFNEANNSYINQASNFIHMGNYLKNLNKNDNFNFSFNKKDNSKIENLKEKFPSKNQNIMTSKERSKEKNPEEFVFQFFYDEQNNSLKNNKKGKSPYNNSTFNKKDRMKNNNKPVRHKLINYRQSKQYYKENQNLSSNDINTQLMNYKSMLTRSSNCSNKERNIKSKENSPRVKRLIKKLYDEGLQDKRKREMIYKENLSKKNEEYKKYSFQPNKKNIKTKNKKEKNQSIKLSKLNEKFYSKQIEWKNKKEKENSQKKKSKEETYYNQFSFKPNISQEYIADDVKMIKRNLYDMNNYILKRRNQIRYKKDDGFKLRDYKQIESNLEDNKYREPLTERIYYRNKNELNTPFVATNKIKFNYSKNDFLKAVKHLHDEIRNLNL